MIAVLLTLLCGAIALCFYLRYALGVARGEGFARKMDKVLHQILNELEFKMLGEFLMKLELRSITGHLGLTSMTEVKNQSLLSPMTRCCAAPTYHLS